MTPLDPSESKLGSKRPPKENVVCLEDDHRKVKAEDILEALAGHEIRDMVVVAEVDGHTRIISTDMTIVEIIGWLALAQASFYPES